MATSEARRLANIANSAKSTGPRSELGKIRSRSNSYKHGLYGNGVVLSVEDAAEVDRRTAAFEYELKPSGELGRALVRRAAFHSVQLDRAMVRENVVTAERMRLAGEAFVPPEGVERHEADVLRDEVKAVAFFSPSKEDCLARRYEAAAERGFYKALKELRQVEKPARGQEPAEVNKVVEHSLASLCQMEKQLAEIEARQLEQAPPPRNPGPMTRNQKLDRLERDLFGSKTGGVDVPITVGRRR